MTIYTFNGVPYDPADLVGDSGRGYNTTVTTGTGAQVPRYIAPMVDALADLANNAQTTSASSITLTQGNPFTAVLAMDVPTLAGAYINLVDAANSANTIYGLVSNYVSATKTVTGTQTQVTGSGTVSSWKVQQRVGRPGATGAAGANGTNGTNGSIASLTQVPRSSNTILGASDSGKQITATSSFTQTSDTPANLGTGWWVFYKNKSTDVVTLNFVIDGRATTVLQPGDAVIISCDGTSRRLLGYAPQEPYLLAAASKIFLANNFT